MQIIGQTFPVCNQQAISSNYLALVTDDILFVDATAAAITISLPPAASVHAARQNTPLYIKKIDASAHAVTIDPNGAETIDGNATLALSVQNQGVELFTDGATWFVLSDKGAGSGTGTVTSVSVASAKGFSGTVANPTTTPAITIQMDASANVLYVGKNGNDAYDGSIASPFLTVGAAIAAAVSGTSVYIGPGTYNENLALVAGVSLQGQQARSCIIHGNMTADFNGTVYVHSVDLETSAGAVLTFSGANATNLQFGDVHMDSLAGASHIIDHSNTNASSKLLFEDGAYNVADSSGGAKVFNSTATSQGSVIWEDISARILDNKDQVCLNVAGAIAFTHTFDDVHGQVSVANTATYVGSLLTIDTTTVASLTTTSTGVSVLLDVLTTTSAANVIAGAGGFAYGNLAIATWAQTTAATLNGGAGAIPLPGVPPVFGASGASHHAGMVPDPGAGAGTTKFLREDATWQVPGGGASLQTSQITVTSGVITTVVTYVTAPFLIPANKLVAGSTYRIKLTGTCTNSASGNNASFDVKFGAAGTIADTSIFTGSTTTPAGGTDQAWEAEFEVVFRSIGAGGTSFCSSRISTTSVNNGISNQSNVIIGADTTHAVDTTINEYLGVAAYTSAGTTSLKVTSATMQQII